MTKQILLSLTIIVLFTGVDCKDSPIPPCADCPPPIDTTSHAWEFETYEFGGAASSTLFDVAIINDSNIICVGEIYVEDSAGNVKNPPFNIAWWNGKKWIFESLYFVFEGASLYATARAVFAFSATDIVVSSASSVMRWNGSSWNNIGVLSSGGTTIGTVLHFWGTSSNNFWGGGFNGSLLKYSNGAWQRIESGTDVDIQDIWGSIDPKTNEQQIIAVASSKLSLPREKKLLKIDGLSATAISDSGLPWSLSGLWFETNKQYYVVGDGLFRKTSLLDTLWQGFHWGLTTYYPNAIRGNNRNDIIVVGAFGVFLHYNGSTWKNYIENELPAIDGSYYSVSIKSNLMVAVGHVGAKAQLLIGKRK